MITSTFNQKKIKTSNLTKRERKNWIETGNKSAIKSMEWRRNWPSSNITAAYDATPFCFDAAPSGPSLRPPRHNRYIANILFRRGASRRWIVDEAAAFGPNKAVDFYRRLFDYTLRFDWTLASTPALIPRKPAGRLDENQLPKTKVDLNKFAIVFDRIFVEIKWILERSRIRIWWRREITLKKWVGATTTWTNRSLDSFSLPSNARKFFRSVRREKYEADRPNSRTKAKRNALSSQIMEFFDDVYTIVPSRVPATCIPPRRTLENVISTSPKIRE